MENQKELTELAQVPEPMTFNVSCRLEAHGNSAISGLCMWLIGINRSEHVCERGTCEDGSTAVCMLISL